MLRLTILSLFLLVGILAHSQNITHIDFEVGFNRAASDHSSMSRMREVPYCTDEVIFRRNGHSSNYFFGVKPEMTLGTKFAIDAGLRLTYSYGRFNPRGWQYHQILWKIDETEQETWLIKVDRMRQRSLYFGIPFDVRFAPMDIDDISIYLKAGCAANFRLVTFNKAYVWDEEKSKRYEELIEDQMGHPDNFTLPVWMAVGLQFGDDQNYCIELQFPYILSLANTTDLCKTRNLTAGFQFTYRLPRFRLTE